MFHQLKATFKIFPILNKIISYNRYRRDIWVENNAKVIPANSNVLDIGAGGCPYRQLFTHCNYKTQDFTQLNSEQIQHEVGYGQIDYVCDIINYYNF